MELAENIRVTVIIMTSFFPPSIPPSSHPKKEIIRENLTKKEI